MTGWNYEDGCHGIYEEASAEIGTLISGLWSLLPETDDPDNTFLVFSLINSTHALSVNLEEIEIEGFNSDVETVYCGYAVHDQLVQVTRTSVRLVDSISRKLRDEWQFDQVLDLLPINIATGNATQVLLATCKDLLYLEIGDGVLNVVKAIEMDVQTSCLDISPVGDNPHRSEIAAMGTWDMRSARIYSLPELDLLKEEPLGVGAEWVPHFILMCSFEKLPYLLCGFHTEHLIKFRLNTSNGSLMNKDEQVFTGTPIFSICPFSSNTNSTPFAFVTSGDGPIVMYSRNNQFIYKNVNLNVQVLRMCFFISPAFPNRLAISSRGNLIIYSIDEVDDGLCNNRRDTAPFSPTP